MYAEMMDERMERWMVSGEIEGSIRRGLGARQAVSSSQTLGQDRQISIPVLRRGSTPNGFFDHLC